MLLMSARICGKMDQLGDVIGCAMQKQTKRLMTADQVAEMLQVSKYTVWRWSRDGTIPSIRLPSGCLRFDPSIIEDLIRCREAS